MSLSTTVYHNWWNKNEYYIGLVHKTVLMLSPTCRDRKSTGNGSTDPTFQRAGNSAVWPSLFVHTKKLQKFYGPPGVRVYYQCTIHVSAALYGSKLKLSYLTGVRGFLIWTMQGHSVKGSLVFNMIYLTLHGDSKRQCHHFVCIKCIEIMRPVVVTKLIELMLLRSLYNAENRKKFIPPR